MRYSKSRSKQSVNSNSKNSTIKLNADIESSLLNTIIFEKENEIFNEKKEANKFNRNSIPASNDKTHDVSYLEEKYNSKKKENSHTHSKLSNAYSNCANKSEIKNENSKTTDSRTLLIQNVNENGSNFNNTYNTNSINTEKFDRSYTSYIINGNKKNSINQHNSVNLTNNTNFYIKPNANSMQGQINYLISNNSVNAVKNENLNVKNFQVDKKENKNEKNGLEASELDKNNNKNDGMFVTSTVIQGENNKEDFSSLRKSNTASNFSSNRQKENSIKSLIDKPKHNKCKSNKRDGNLKLKEEEILALNKIIEQEIVKRNQKIEYSGLGSQYNKINSFDLKFNKDLAKISRVYGKLESRNKFVNKDQYDELIQEVNDFQSYRNIKVVNEKHNHKFRLLPLINNKRSSFEVLAKNFFLNIKTQKESPDYFNIDEEFDSYMKNKSDKGKYKSLFDEEEKPNAE